MINVSRLEYVAAAIGPSKSGPNGHGLFVGHGTVVIECVAIGKTHCSNSSAPRMPGTDHHLVNDHAPEFRFFSSRRPAVVQPHPVPEYYRLGNSAIQISNPQSGGDICEPAVLSIRSLS